METLIISWNLSSKISFVFINFGAFEFNFSLQSHILHDLEPENGIQYFLSS